MEETKDTSTKFYDLEYDREAVLHSTPADAEPLLQEADEAGLQLVIGKWLEEDELHADQALDAQHAIQPALAATAHYNGEAGKVHDRLETDFNVNLEKARELHPGLAEKQTALATASANLGPKVQEYITAAVKVGIDIPKEHIGDPDYLKERIRKARGWKTKQQITDAKAAFKRPPFKAPADLVDPVVLARTIMPPNPGPWVEPTRNQPEKRRYKVLPVFTPKAPSIVAVLITIFVCLLGGAYYGLVMGGAAKAILRVEMAKALTFAFWANPGHLALAAIGAVIMYFLSTLVEKTGEAQITTDEDWFPNQNPRLQQEARKQNVNFKIILIIDAIIGTVAGILVLLGISDLGVAQGNDPINPALLFVGAMTLSVVLTFPCLLYKRLRGRKKADEKVEFLRLRKEAIEYNEKCDSDIEDYNETFEEDRTQALELWEEQTTAYNDAFTANADEAREERRQELERIRLLRDAEIVYDEETNNLRKQHEAPLDKEEREIEAQVTRLLIASKSLNAALMHCNEILEGRETVTRLVGEIQTLEGEINPLLVQPGPDAEEVERLQNLYMVASRAAAKVKELMSQNSAAPK